MNPFDGIEINPETQFTGDFEAILQELLENGGLSDEDKAALSHFMDYIQKYDHSFAYSINGLFVIVFAHGENTVTIGGDNAMVGVYFDSGQIILTPQGDTITPNKAFYDSLWDLMDANGWEFQDKPLLNAEEPDAWENGNCASLLKEMLTTLPAHATMDEEQLIMLSRLLQALTEAVPDTFTMVSASYGLQVLFRVQNPDYVEEIEEEPEIEEPEEEDELEEIDDEEGAPSYVRDWTRIEFIPRADDAEEEDDGEEYIGQYISVAFRISPDSKMVGLNYGEDVAYIPVKRSYLEYVVDLLAENGNSGQFGINMPKEESADLNPINLYNDELALAIVNCYMESETLTAKQTKMMDKFLENFPNSHERYITFFPKGFQILCMNKKSDTTQYFMLSTYGSAIVMVGKSDFNASYSNAFIPNLKRVLAQYGQERWL